MKALNYDTRTLIMQNIKPDKRFTVPAHFTRSQYLILRKIIIQKKISKRFFDFIISGLFDKSDWKVLDYNQMYMLIYVLQRYDYKKKEGSK